MKIESDWSVEPVRMKTNDMTDSKALLDRMCIRIGTNRNGMVHYRKTNESMVWHQSPEIFFS